MYASIVFLPLIGALIAGWLALATVTVRQNWSR